MLALLAFGPGISTASADGHKGVVGAAYSETNGVPDNALIAYDRLSNGQLVQREVVPTGGSGGREPQPGCEPPGGCPILDTQGEVIVTEDGKLVFAVNAGSNTITSFRETDHGLKRVDQEPSGGEFPNSLTVHDHMLFVLNSNSNSIAGFRYSSHGEMAPIPGSVRSVSAAAPPPVSPREIGFDNTGHILAVSLLGPSLIDTFVVDKSGRPGPPTSHPSTTPLPFGFAFDKRNHLVMSQVTSLPGIGNTATYNLNTRNGDLTPIDTETSGGQAPCWVVVTNDGRYTFVVNAGGGAPATIARYRLSESGFLTLLGQTPPNGSEFARTDEALSRDSRYLYVLNPGVFTPTSKIDEYRVERNGDLTLIGNTPADGPEGQSGLAAR